MLEHVAIRDRKKLITSVAKPPWTESKVQPCLDWRILYSTVKAYAAG